MKTHEIIEEFIDQPNGTVKYVRAVRAVVGCCSYEIIRDSWLKEEITSKMEKEDMKLIHKNRGNLVSRHRAGCNLPIHFCLHRLRVDHMSPEERVRDDNLQKLLRSFYSR